MSCDEPDKIFMKSGQIFCFADNMDNIARTFRPVAELYSVHPSETWSSKGRADGERIKNGVQTDRRNHERQGKPRQQCYDRRRRFRGGRGLRLPRIFHKNLWSKKVHPPTKYTMYKTPMRRWFSTGTRPGLCSRKTCNHSKYLSVGCSGPSLTVCRKTMCGDEEWITNSLHSTVNPASGRW